MPVLYCRRRISRSSRPVLRGAATSLLQVEPHRGQLPISHVACMTIVNKGVPFPPSRRCRMIQKQNRIPDRVARGKQYDAENRGGQGCRWPRGIVLVLQSNTPPEVPSRAMTGVEILFLDDHPYPGSSLPLSFLSFCSPRFCFPRLHARENDFVSSNLAVPAPRFLMVAASDLVRPSRSDERTGCRTPYVSASSSAVRIELTRARARDMAKTHQQDGSMGPGPVRIGHLSPKMNPERCWRHESTMAGWASTDGPRRIETRPPGLRKECSETANGHGFLPGLRSRLCTLDRRCLTLTRCAP